MKIIKQVKKVLISAIIYIYALQGKVFGAILYGPVNYDLELEPLPPEPDHKLILIENILNIFRMIIMPILLLIGLIVYIKKSKSSKKRKIIITIALIALAVAIYFLLGYISNNL